MAWRTHPQRLTDLLLALAVVTYGLVERGLSDTHHSWASLLVVLPLSAAPVAVRSRWPAPAALACTGGLALASVLGLGLDESFAALFGPVLTTFSVGRASPPITVVVVVLGGAAGLFAASAVSGSALPADDASIMVASIVVAAGVGRASQEMQLETDVLRQQREADVRAAAEQERLRIARELHDVLGHTVSVMGIQAAAVRRRLPPEQRVERDALEAVEAAGREAVSELRRLLGLLRAPDALPEAGALASSRRLAAVVEDVRRSGLRVELVGEAVVDDLPPAVALTVVRVVQEGLTNVLRHAPGASAVVAVRSDGHRVDVSVADDGPGAAGGEGGFGLVGMRERVSVFGGTLQAGPGPAGGFLLEARLPADAG